MLEDPYAIRVIASPDSNGRICAARSQELAVRCKPKAESIAVVALEQVQDAVADVWIKTICLPYSRHAVLTGCGRGKSRVDTDIDIDQGTDVPCEQKNGNESG